MKPYKNYKENKHLDDYNILQQVTFKRKIEIKETKEIQLKLT